jgi:Tfp pilus assembly protein PilV
MKVNRTFPGNRLEAAFSLPEVIIGVLLLTMMAISLYAGLSSGIWITQSAREDLRATQILVQKIEALRLCNWTSLSNAPGSFREVYDPTRSGSSGQSYYGKIALSVPNGILDSASYKTNTRLATVSLCWTNHNGTKPVVHTREMQTLVARYGLQNYMGGPNP